MGTVKLMWMFMRITSSAWETTRKLSSILLMALLLTGFMETASAGPLEPSWKVGRAKIELQKDNGGQRRLYLKLSLRNEGDPGNIPVEILGRWGKSIQHQKEEDFTQLGRYTRQVALKQTAILVISLESLGPVPRGKPPFELVVITGSRVTDRQVVHLP